MRYSTDKQDETSIENQVRKCRELAAKEGLTILDDDLYADHAVTGQASGMAKRTAFRRLLDAWDARLIDFVFAYELSRLTRDEADGALLLRRVRETGVVVITGDGIDTRRPNWEMQWMLALMMSGQEVRNVSNRTSNSMHGVLSEGGMLSAPAFGYMLDPLRLQTGSKVRGARWLIHEHNAGIVRQMYNMRKAGMSSSRIAAELNTRGIASPRAGRDGQPSTWRAASVHRVLANPVYRGVVVYQGSAFTRAKLKKKRQTPKLMSFARETYRIVDDALWFACNPPSKQAIRGGVRHVLAGLVRCGDCGSKLSLKVIGKSGAANCPSCEQKYRAQAADSWMGYTSIPAATQALHAALVLALGADVRTEFQRRLKERLEAPRSDEEERLADEVRALAASKARLLKLGANPLIGDEAVESELASIVPALKTAEARLAQVRERSAALKPAAVKAQLEVDIEPLVRRLIAGEPDVHHVRAVLSRVLHRFAFVRRPRRGVSVFEIGFMPGALAAAQADGELLDDLKVLLSITVTSTRKVDQPWQVDVQRL